MKLEPQAYLTPRGVDIFNDILSCLDSKILQSTDSYGLSILAQNYDMQHEMAILINEKGVSQTTKTDYSQVRAEFTVFQKTADYISKNASAFGLTPEARERLKELWAKKQKKQSSLAALVNTSTT